MTDYTELVESLRHCAIDRNCQACEYDTTRHCVDHLKTDAADAIEALLPKRGEWISYEFNTNGTWHKCSVCGVAYQYKDAPNSGWWINHKYCPNCGAKMEVQE